MVSSINPNVKSSLSDITEPSKEEMEIKKSKKLEDSETRIKRQKRKFSTLLTTKLKSQDPTSPVAVSYTHLDVYKRQVEICNRRMQEVAQEMSRNSAQPQSPSKK